MNNGVLSDKSLIADLLAPTVPSEPKPMNTHSTVLSATNVNMFFLGNDNLLTSSLIEVVKWLSGLDYNKLSSQATTSAVMKSLDD